MYRGFYICTGDSVDLYCIGRCTVFCMKNVCNNIGDIYVLVFGTNILCRYLYSLGA